MRCEAILRVKIPDDALADAASVREEIISQFGELFAMEVGDPTLNELDFYEWYPSGRDRGAMMRLTLAPWRVDQAACWFTGVACAGGVQFQGISSSSLCAG